MFEERSWYPSDGESSLALPQVSLVEGVLPHRSSTDKHWLSFVCSETDPERLPWYASIVELHWLYGKMESVNVMIPPKNIIEVDCENVIGELKHIWTSIGFDEINWSYTGRGKYLLRTLKDQIMEKPYYVRNHNVFTSGNGLSYPAGGSTNIYMEDVDGNATYNFELVDKIYDNYVENNCIPIVELGFMPLDFVPGAKQVSSDWRMGRDVGREEYEQSKWKSPPKDYQKWQGLVETFLSHLCERYGEQVQHWYFEVWNEPNLTNYWIGSVEDYCKLYDYSAQAVKRVNKSLKVGGPATSDIGVDFLRKFLVHVTSGRNHVTGDTGSPIDFISFHTKGAYYVPRKCYGRPVDSQSPSLSKILDDIRNNLSVCHQFESLNHLPIFVDECDPAVGTIYGVYDNPNFIVCNTEYYPSMVAAMIYHISLLSPRIELITHWSFYMEGKRLFEGNRTLMTNYNLHLPILSGLKLFGKLKHKQLSVRRDEVQAPVYAIATADDENRSLQFLLFYHLDDWTYEDMQIVEIHFDHIPYQSVLLTHYRIDAVHSNPHTKWIQLGRPEEPNESQLRELKQSQELQLLHPPKEYKIIDRQLRLESFTLPAHAVSFIELVDNAH